LVDGAPRSEEEVVEARYALADAKPKASAEAEPSVRDRPPGEEAPAGSEPTLQKAPSRAAFPDALP